MDDKHILHIGNIPKVIACLSTILEKDQIDLIRNEQYKNAQQLLKLGKCHFKYAIKYNGKYSWRQKISRAYYACYSASRAIRLAIDGTYNTQPDDHKKISDLPRDFPSIDLWKNFFTQMRLDRNAADYDHTAKQTDLVMSINLYMQKTREFLSETENYLTQRGIL